MSAEVLYVTASNYFSCPQQPGLSENSPAPVDTARLPAELREEPLYFMYTPSRSMLQLSKEIAPGDLIKQIAEAEDVLYSEMFSGDRQDPASYEEDTNPPRKPHAPDRESIALAHSAAGTVNVIYAIAYDKPDNLRKAVYHFLKAQEGLAIEDLVYNTHRASEAAAILDDQVTFWECMDVLLEYGTIAPEDIQAHWDEYEDIRDRWRTKGPRMLPTIQDEFEPAVTNELGIEITPSEGTALAERVANACNLGNFATAFGAMDVANILNERVHDKSRRGEVDGEIGSYHPPIL